MNKKTLAKPLYQWQNSLITCAFNNSTFPAINMTTKQNLYLPEQDSDYMSSAMLNYFKELLETNLKLLKHQLTSLVEELSQANDSSELNETAAIGEHQLESAVTGELIQDQIHAIEHALGKVKEGTYGYCEENGEALGVKRLLAYPEARYCVEVQQRLENLSK